MVCRGLGVHGSLASASANSNTGVSSLIHQIQYRFKRKPTKKDVDKARQCWLDGESRFRFSVSPLSWCNGATRQAVRSGYIGQAGIVKCYGRPNRTLTDHDTKKAPSLSLVWRIARLCQIRPRVIRIDRTRHGWHMVIEWDRNFTPWQIVALQCVLGSDRRREAYNLARVFSGKSRNRRWNLLFSEKLT
jgi:hypothetical protein